MSRLTAHEAEVLRLLSRGLTDAETARRPDVGPATAKSHIAAVPAGTGPGTGPGR
ncbi:hypothetical protein ACWELO_15745 [Streptomyces sp. NPDC004596]